MPRSTGRKTVGDSVVYVPLREHADVLEDYGGGSLMIQLHVDNNRYITCNESDLVWSSDEMPPAPPIDYDR